MFSDSHCHLEGVYDRGPDTSRRTDEVIENAKKKGFELLLTSGIDLISSEQAVRTAGKYNIVKACVGIHPWYADEYNEDARRFLRKLAENPEVVAVSEIGLDHVGRWTKDWVYEDRTIEKEVQRTAFIEQLKLAKELDLPVLVHDKTPDQELLDIIEGKGNAKIGIAIHDFSQGPEYAERCVDMGIYLSIGPRLLKADPLEIIEAVEQTPIEWILTETDVDNPEDVQTVAERIAELKFLTRDQVGQAATRNLKNLIGLRA